MRLIYNLITVTIIGMGLLLTSCVEEIDLADLNGPPTNTLVVEGSITSAPKAHAVKLSRTNDAVVTQAPQSVSGAIVTISDGESAFLLKEHVAGSGIYLTDSTVRGEAGKTYTLTVEADGKVYKASDKMEPVASFSESDNNVLGPKYLFGSFDRGFNFEIPLASFGFPEPVLREIGFINPDQAKEKNLKVRTRFYQFPGVEVNGLIPLIAEPIVFFEGDSMYLSRLSMSEAHFKFIKALLIQSEYFGGALGSVPADIPTNLSGGAVGFFSASDVVYGKFSISRKEGE